MIADGIALYNVFRTTPARLTLYNPGSVASAAAIAFLGARTRVGSKHSTFMFHRPYSNPQPGQRNDSLASIAVGLRLDEARTEAVMREVLTLTEIQWEAYQKADLYLGPAEALDASLIHEIGEFAPPTGTQVFNI